VILAGGAGERLWPASRRARPKQLLEVVDGQSLLAATWQRARRIAGKDRVWIVCGREQAASHRRETGLPASRILVEPARRNTAMAVAWAAHRIAREDPEAVFAVLPADHLVPDVGQFARDMRRAADAAREAGALVTLGVRPTRPDTGYGYIQLGRAAGRAHPGLRHVRRFVEKPDLATARRYLARGGYRWNAGIFAWRADVLLEEIARHAPELHRALAPLRGPKAKTRAAVERAFRRAPSLPIDVAVLERSDRVWSLPTDLAWSDVGTWASLAEELGVGTPGGKGSPEEHGNRVISGELLAEGASNNLVWGGERIVALVGVEDLAVVDTEDVILVTKLERGSDVRRIVATLNARGLRRLT
jgi:mannose-1-phosphate guanylyltransferase/mannose-6-phosphate isomerase